MATAKKTPSKASRPNQSSFTSTDLRETYEMLRASHTLLRMAFGALTLLCAPDKEEQAKKMVEHFDYCFRCIASGAEKILKDSESDSKQN